MAESLLALRRKAKAAGMTGTRGADREELQAFLSENGGGTKRRVVKKRTKRAPAKRTTAKRRAPVRKPATKRKPATTPKRTTTSTKAGRNSIDERALDFSADGFNTRAGGDREMIFKAIKASRGNREKAFDKLLPNISRLVPAKKQNGEKRTKAERESFLRYLINRVLFDFAVATGQHQASKNRAEYGTGGTGTGTFKRGKTRKPAGRKPATRKTTTAKRGVRARKGTRKR